MKKRIAALLLCLSMLFTLVLASACAPANQPTPEPTPADKTEDADKTANPDTEQIPDDPIPDDPTPDDPTPDDPTPDDPTPDDPTPDDPAPDDPTPDDPTPDDPVPADSGFDPVLYQKLERGAQKTLQAIGENQTESSLLSVLENAIKSGWFGVSYTNHPEAATNIPDFSAGIWHQDLSGAVEIRLENNESSIGIDAWANVPGAENTIVLQSDALLHGAYGIDLQQLFLSFLQSIPAEVWENENLMQLITAAMAMAGGENTDFEALDLSEVLESLAESGIWEELTGMEDLDLLEIVDLFEAIQSAKALISTFLEETFIITESQKEVTTLGEKINANCITVTLPEGSFSAWIDALSATLEDEPSEIVQKIEIIYPYLLSMLEYLKDSPFGSYVEGLELPEDPSEISNLSAEDLKVILYMIQSVLSKVSVDFSVFFNENDEIVRLESALLVQSVPVTAVLELGKNPGNGKGEFAFSLKLPLLGDLLSLKSEKTATGRKISFQYNGLIIPQSEIMSASAQLTIPDEQGKTELSVSVFKRGEGLVPEVKTLQASYSYWTETASVGDVEYTLHSIGRFSVVVDGEALLLPDVEITVCESFPDFPATPEYIDIATLTNNDYGVLLSFLKSLLPFDNQSEEWTDDPIDAPTYDEEEEQIQMLSVYTCTDYVPYEYINDNGEIVGVDIEVIKAVANALGYVPVIYDVEFDQILSEVQIDPLAVGIAGMTLTPHRLEVALASDVYATSVPYVVAPKGAFEEGAVISAADLKAYAQGGSVGVQTNTSEEFFVEEYDISVIEYANAFDLGMQIGVGVKAGVVDRAVAQGIVQGNPALSCWQLDEQAESYVIYFNMEAADLVEEANRVIANLVAGGSVDSWITLYSFFVN